MVDWALVWKRDRWKVVLAAEGGVLVVVVFFLEREKVLLTGLKWGARRIAIRLLGWFLLQVEKDLINDPLLYTRFVIADMIIPTANL